MRRIAFGVPACEREVWHAQCAARFTSGLRAIRSADCALCLLAERGVDPDGDERYRHPLIDRPEYDTA